MHQVMQKLQLVQSPFQIATIAEMATVITAESEAKNWRPGSKSSRLGSNHSRTTKERRGLPPREKGSWKLGASCKMRNAAKEFFRASRKANPEYGLKRFSVLSTQQFLARQGEPASIGGKHD